MRQITKTGITLFGLVLVFLTVCAATCFGQDNEQKKHRLVVSFISECCGTNKKAEDKFKKIVAAEERKRRVKLASTETRWGREGEHDYCFDLKELTFNKRKIFIRKLQKSLATYKLVQVKQNDYCQSGRL